MVPNDRHGILVVDKPVNMTSAEVVRVVKQRLRAKVGHLGTLDPFASGVLPLCLGDGTKIAQFLNAQDKDYTGIIRLGTETDTGDPSGTVTATAPVPPLAGVDLAVVARTFEGESLQMPPMYSAIKRQGVPLYKLARRGIAVERELRRVRISALRLTDLRNGTIEFSVTCSKGTYVRVLTQQIAVALGCVGHLEQLRRTRFGSFRIEDAIALTAVAAEALPLIGLREALHHLPEIRIDAASVQRARQGYQPLLLTFPAGACDEAAKLVGPDEELAAVIAVDALGRWRFARVFTDPPEA